VVGSPELSLRLASGRVVELLLTSASKLRPSLSRPLFPSDCHARVAALFVTGFSLRGADVIGARGLGFLPVRSEDLNVCNIVLPFSGLGLLEVFFIGGTNMPGADVDDSPSLELEGL
jgi:hypothetical protein